MYEKIKKLIILFIVILLLFGCSNKIDETLYKENKIYVLNKNSRKIHDYSCNSALIMSDRNRKVVEDSLENLVNNGYSICKNCNAGIKKNFVLDIFSSDKNFDLPTVDEYRKAIKIMGEWYINHIPTYQTELEEELISEYKGEYKCVQEYELKNVKHGEAETKNKYLVISTKSNAIKIDKYDKNNSVLRGTEQAVIYYKKNYDAMKKDNKKDTYYYPCELINKSKGTYKKAGDDCVRYLFSFLNLMNNNFVKNIENKSKIKWSRVNTKRIVEANSNFSKAMKMSGFDIFDSENNIDYKLITKDFVLQYGDIIARDGHVHIYLGNGEEQSMGFGWGKVYRNFPENKNFIIKLNNKGNYYISSIEMNEDKQFVEKQYTRVFRYRGGIKNE